MEQWNGDWEGWLEFFLQGIGDVANEAAQTARQIINLREEHQRLVAFRLEGSAGNGMTLLEALYKRPVVTARDVQDIIGAAAPTAYRLVDRFKELGLLEEITGKARGRAYRYGPYIRLFSDN